MDEREDTVGRLLEGTTNFSRAERDEIFDDVFAAVDAEQRAAAPRPVAWPAWLRWLALAAVVCLAIVPASFLIDTKPEFVARGGSGTNLELRCSGDGACSVDDALTFEVSGARRPWFAAFARNADGAVVWYFPESETATSIEIRAGLLDRAVRLGEHEAGAWTVYAVFSHAPMTRDDVKTCFDERGKLRCDDVELLERALVIE